MGKKDRVKRQTKKQPAHTLKEKRRAKQERKSGGRASL